MAYALTKPTSDSQTALHMTNSKGNLASEEGEKSKSGKKLDGSRSCYETL